MANEFIRMRMVGDVHPLHWKRALNVSQIVNILPLWREANIEISDEKDLTIEEEKDLKFFRAIPEDSTEATERALWHGFEVTDSLGNKYRSDLGPGSDVNNFLSQLYEDSLE